MAARPLHQLRHNISNPPIHHHPPTPTPPHPPSTAPTSSSTIQRVVGDTIHLTNLHHDVKNGRSVRYFLTTRSAYAVIPYTFDERGRSLGTATITFTRSEIADAAVAEFDGAEIDGKAMAVKLVGQVVQQRLGGGGSMAGSMLDPMLNPAAAMMLPAMLQMMAAGMPPVPHINNPSQHQQQRQQAGGRGRDRAGERNEKRKGDDRGKGREQSKADGAAAGKAGGKGARSKQEKAPLTAQDLDAEMESYHTQRTATASSTASGSESLQPAESPIAASE